LRKGAERAAPGNQNIRNERSLNSEFFSDLSSDNDGAAERENASGDQITNSTFVSFNSSLLGSNLANSAQPGDEEDFNVREAIEETGIPSSRHRVREG